MTDPRTIEERIGLAYPELSAKLRSAADFTLANPVEIATRSLRGLAALSDVSPATFSRLARALGYDEFAAMQEDARAGLGRGPVPFSERAQASLSEDGHKSGGQVLGAQAMACVANIQSLAAHIDTDRLEAAADVLYGARTVLLVGSLGSSGFVDYFGYLAHWFSGKWIVAGRNGTSLAAALSRLDRRDAVFVLSKSPHARRSVAALKASREGGVPTVLITDSHVSPALRHADHAFVVPVESPMFFSSYAATIVLIEALMSLLLAREGPEAEQRIRAAEAQIEKLGESWEE